jgi:hypothetical protein
MCATDGPVRGGAAVFRQLTYINEAMDVSPQIHMIFKGCSSRFKPDSGYWGAGGGGALQGRGCPTTLHHDDVHQGHTAHYSVVFIHSPGKNNLV